MHLKSGVTLTFDRPGRLQFDSRLCTMAIEHPDIAEPLVSCLRHSDSIPNALATLQIDTLFKQELLAFLDEHRFVSHIPRGTVQVRADLAAREMAKEIGYWADNLYCDAFWAAIYGQTNLDYAQSTAERVQPGVPNALYAWAVENFHHTRSVVNHLGTAVAHLDHGQITAKAIQHLAEEWDHPFLFGLSASRFRNYFAVLEPADSSELVPLGATRAVSLFLENAAKKHFFVYKSCAAVLEHTAQRVQQTHEFFHQACANQGIPYSIAKPMVLHAQTDDHFDHQNSLTEFANLYRHVPRAVLAMAMEDAWRFSELLYLWQVQMLDWYSQFEPGHGHRTLAARGRVADPLRTVTPT